MWSTKGTGQELVTYTTNHIKTLKLIHTKHVNIKISSELLTNNDNNLIKYSFILCSLVARHTSIRCITPNMLGCFLIGILTAGGIMNLAVVQKRLKN